MDSRDEFERRLKEGYEALDPEKEEREHVRELLYQREQQRKKRIKTFAAFAGVLIAVSATVLAVNGTCKLKQNKRAK